MNVKVLQGINLKNSVTTVVAEMEAVKPELLDFVKNLHPVFMVDYQIVEGKTLEVQTHLPNLWKKEDMLQPIEDFSTGKADFDSAKAQVLSIILLLVSSVATIPILKA